MTGRDWQSRHGEAEESWICKVVETDQPNYKVLITLSRALFRFKNTTMPVPPRHKHVWFGFLKYCRSRVTTVKEYERSIYKLAPIPSPPIPINTPKHRHDIWRTTTNDIDLDLSSSQARNNENGSLLVIPELYDFYTLCINNNNNGQVMTVGYYYVWG